MAGPDDNELDRILFRIAGAGGAVHKAGVDPDELLEAPTYLKAKAALNAYQLSKALKIVGKDEIDPNAKTVWFNGILRERNKFRVELRKAFNQEWGQ